MLQQANTTTYLTEIQTQPPETENAGTIVPTKKSNLLVQQRALPMAQYRRYMCDRYVYIVMFHKLYPYAAA